MYYGSGLAAQHSDRPYPLFLNIPGLKLISPSTAADVKGLLKSAVRDDDPVIVFEDTRLWPVKGEVPSDPDFLIPIGKADVKITGTDVTLVAVAGAMRATLEAAKTLSAEGIAPEVIDPRTLKPLDMDTILESVSKTRRLVVIENGHRMANVGAEIAAVVCEQAFDCLAKPIIRLSAPDVHVPFSPALEQLLYPTKEKIVATVKSLL
jgi:acetoin:2,6-dichlorophenolindophenol oxidoreductase subunit beta